MAIPNRQNHQQPVGLFHIDDRCIGCSLCYALAPSLFGEDLSMDRIADAAYIRRQPETVAETLLCQEALQHCPTNAIEEKVSINHR